MTLPTREQEQELVEQLAVLVQMAEIWISSACDIPEIKKDVLRECEEITKMWENTKLNIHSGIISSLSLFVLSVTQLKEVLKGYTSDVKE